MRDLEDDGAGYLEDDGVDRHSANAQVPVIRLTPHTPSFRQCFWAGI
ncbi:hypothetical protein [Shewanella gaetbuli]|uniref:Uncharacterized protein n=1 Tax=Shewanella gaetbuli TaxID=220752 RepID=A0A9X2CH97_9GAMM|nr:hypothetical protein [Shewanella gaetbuli]MCL1143268.1 hypothetical protein [Shewanella gaetbuli]